jgi:hypothetical protein
MLCSSSMFSWRAIGFSIMSLSLFLRLQAASVLYMNAYFGVPFLQATLVFAPFSSASAVACAVTWSVLIAALADILHASRFAPGVVQLAPSWQRVVTVSLCFGEQSGGCVSFTGIEFVQLSGELGASAGAVT